VLNSLSLDFIVASFASLRENGAFEEIGKRGIWASDRHLASVSSTSYSAIALDADMEADPTWYNMVLRLLASRGATGAATSLPWQSFDMEAQHELAFRKLQSGQNTGKIVVHIASKTMGCDGVHAVTGGTGGLGLLTGRWLAQRGASSLVLASRSGVIAEDMDAEWKTIQASEVNPALMRCDTSEEAHVARLMALDGSLVGVWHAAGVLADAVLPKQDAPGLASVYAPKAHGAWNLHAAGATSAVNSVHFASTAGLLGGPGQSNYAAANACLDAMAKCKRAQGGCAASIDWGPWAEVGMASGGMITSRMKAMGQGLIDAWQGISALMAALQPQRPASMAFWLVRWDVMIKPGSAVPPLLQGLAPRAAPARRVVAVAAAAPKAILPLSTVLELVQTTAGDAVSADAPLMEAGIDSLGAAELRNQLQATVGENMTLPATLLFDHPTVRQLATHFDVLTVEADAPASIAFGLDEVLELVTRTAGGDVSADAPLMEAGIDSLGAVELRN
jgi:NAD(P)-dependent dehydrogenase (short-subunit alcohol dehydrogenase family)/acyl carrier protein